MSDDRAELAFRTALAVDDLPATPSNRTIKHRVRQRRIGSAVALGALVLALIAGTFAAVSLPGIGLTSPVAGGVAGELPVDAAPDGWRTDYFRDISFQVPTGWGYAYEPASDWCTEDTLGVRTSPYVAQGLSQTSAYVDCVPQAAGPKVDHVLVVPRPEGEGNNTDTIDDGWWTIQRISAETVLSVTSRDEALARKIVASIQQNPADALCAPHNPVERQPASRPEPPFDLAQLRPASVSAMAVCEYDSTAFSDETGLRATASLPQDQARTAVRAIQAGAPGGESCRAVEQGVFTAVLRIQAKNRVYEVNLAAGCQGGLRSAGVFDDGTNARAVTRAACDAVVVPPISLPYAAGAMGVTCGR